MALTNEKAKEISDFLTADIERGKGLLDLAPDVAAKEMCDAGVDVTADELIEFGNAMKQESGNEELNASELDNVSGGIGAIAAYAIGCGIAFGVGYVTRRVEKW